MDNITLKNMIELYDKSTELLKDVAINHHDSLSKQVKAKMLVTAMYKKDNEFCKSLFNVYSLPEILIACEIMDAKRKITKLKNKLNQTDKIKKDIIKLEKLNEGLNISLTGSVSQFIKKFWIKNIPANTLEYWVICKYSVDKWKKLNDLIHFSACDFAIERFYDYVVYNNFFIYLGYEYDELINNPMYKFLVSKNINLEDAIELITKYKLTYNFVKEDKLLKKYIDNDSIKKIFNYKINKIIVPDYDFDQICVNI